MTVGDMIVRNRLADMAAHPERADEIRERFVPRSLQFERWPPARDQRAASANARPQAPRSPQDVGNSAEDKAADAAAQGQEA